MMSQGIYASLLFSKIRNNFSIVFIFGDCDVHIKFSSSLKCFLSYSVTEHGIDVWMGILFFWKIIIYLWKQFPYHRMNSFSQSFQIILTIDSSPKFISNPPPCLIFGIWESDKTLFCLSQNIHMARSWEYNKE